MPADTPTVDLSVCPECDRDLVYPVDWEEASPTHWEVELRCPNCEWNEIGTYDPRAPSTASTSTWTWAPTPS